MPQGRKIRFTVIALVLALAVVWTAASAESEPAYSNQQFVATAAWLKAHRDDPKLMVVDVRTDKHFDGKVIAGAVRLPWSLLRYNDRAENIGGAFVGTAQAQEILGRHGITRDREVVLYDDRARDGGATASYVFWVLDVLGHPKMRVLEGGIEAWTQVGGEVSSEAATPSEALYQAPAKEIALRRWQEGSYIYDRLGDPYYQILDVRSQAEYLGEAPNAGLDGRVLKLGHIPGAYNVDYRLNWVDSQSKGLKGPGELARLYAGLDPRKAVIVYCHSGRRSSYSYYVLRVMGFEDVICYGRSWNEWGGKGKHFPVETESHQLSGGLPRPTQKASAGMAPSTSGEAGDQRQLGGPAASGGYISCGG